MNDFIISLVQLVCCLVGNTAYQTVLVTKAWHTCIQHNILQFTQIFNVNIVSVDSNNLRIPVHSATGILCKCWPSPRIVSSCERRRSQGSSPDESVTGQFNPGCEDHFLFAENFCWMHYSLTHCDAPHLYSKPPQQLAIHRPLKWNSRIH